MLIQFHNTVPMSRLRSLVAFSVLWVAAAASASGSRGVQCCCNGTVYPTMQCYDDPTCSFVNNCGGAAAGTSTGAQSTGAQSTGVVPAGSYVWTSEYEEIVLTFLGSTVRMSGGVFGVKGPCNGYGTDPQIPECQLSAKRRGGGPVEDCLQP